MQQLLLFSLSAHAPAPPLSPVSLEEKQKIRQQEYYQKNKEKARQYYLQNREKILQKSKEWIKNNREYREEILKRNKLRYHADIEKSRKYQRKYGKENREKEREYGIKYYEKHKEKILQRVRERSKRPDVKEKNNKRKKEYRKKDPAKWNQINNRCRKKRLQNNPDFRLYCRAASDLNRYLRKVKQSKYSRTFHMLGYSLQNLREHVEKEMKPGMTWDNFGKKGWHIEHKMPKALFEKISTFTDSEQIKQQIIKECWSLSNLTTMIGAENLKKSDIMYGNYRARYIEKIQDITQDPDTINYLQNNNMELLQICIQIEKQGYKNEKEEVLEEKNKGYTGKKGVIGGKT